MSRVSGMRRAALAVAVVLVSGLPLGAQSESRMKEVRLTLASLSSGEDVTAASVFLPGDVTLAWFATPRVAIEPRIGFSYSSVKTPLGDTRSGGSIGVGAFVPFYLKADNGRSGLFVAPGLTVSEPFGDFGGRRLVAGGLDLGYKQPIRERISLRWALELRDRDSDDELRVGGSLGISLFWR